MYLVVIEKSAGFVAKNGREFEAKILENERNNPKFSFMNSIDPYHLYYRKRLEELIEGGSGELKF
jgi:splicing factor 3A subunit 1